jgi:AmiR/NasT family two-component response regulator
MERLSLDEEHAFAYLKRQSQNHNIKIRDLAAHLVETRQLPGA